MTIFIMVQGTVCVPRGAHLYIKGWLPSHINVAVTANEMRAGLSVSVCRHGIKPSASCCNRKRCGGERCREVCITELNASEPFDEVSLIVFQVMSKVSVGQF